MVNRFYPQTTAAIAVHGLWIDIAINHTVSLTGILLVNYLVDTKVLVLVKECKRVQTSVIYV